MNSLNLIKGKVKVLRTPNNVNRLSSILSNVTKDVEFMAFSFSITPQGYEKRIKQRIDIIEAFPDGQTWDVMDDDYELSQEVLDILAQHRTC